MSNTDKYSSQKEPIEIIHKLTEIIASKLYSFVEYFLLSLREGSRSKIVLCSASKDPK